MLFEAVEARKNSSPERFERTLHCLIFHSEGTSTLICAFPIYFKSQRSNFSIRDENKTFWSFTCKIWPTIQCAVITIVFLTVWLAGHKGCVWGRKSINNGVITVGFFWPRALRVRSCIEQTPLIRLFCRRSNNSTLFTKGEIHYYWLPGSLHNGPRKMNK